MGQLVSGSVSKALWILGCGLSVALTVVIVVVAVQKDARIERDVLIVRVGEVVSIGDLDLTIVGTAPFQPGKSASTDANYAVRFRAANARGGRDKPYELTYTDLKVLDTTGTTRDTVSCVQCPGVTGDDVSVKIRAGDFVDGTFYYKLPPGVQPNSITYGSQMAKQTAKVHVGGAVQGAAPPR
jgi:hypothetical protein